MKTSLVMASVLTIFLGGCTATGLNNALDKDGFPKPRYCVGGGGLGVEYHTQESGGTLIYADNVSRKVMVTKSMTPKDEFELSLNPADKSSIEALKAIGIDPLNMKLSLYFIPLENTAGDDTK